MANALVITEDMSDDQLNEMLGITTKSNEYTHINKLRVNKEPEDDDGNPLPFGQWYVDFGKDQPRHYAKEVTLRLLTNTVMFKNYDSKEGKLVDETVMLPNAFGEFLSRSGKTRCGKLTAKQVANIGEENLGRDQADTQKSVKFRQLLFVTVSYTGKDKKGETKEFNDVPALIDVGNSWFDSIKELQEFFKKSGKAAIKYPIKATPKKEKIGETIFFTPILKIADKPEPFNEAILEAVKAAGKYIESHNRSVREDYDKNLNKRSEEVVAEKAVKAAGVTIDRNAEVIDEIPF